MNNFTTLYWPQGLANGKFTPWIIQWLLPDGAANGFLIQQIEYQIEATNCGGDPISEDEIWNQMDYQGPPKFNYWESWQIKNGIWIGPGNKDSWIEPGGTFYSNLTSGTIVITGTSGFYEIAGLDDTGSNWGANGENDGSPMSGALLSTTIAPANLPTTSLFTRTMTVNWDPCDSDSGQAPTTVVTDPPQIL